MKQALETMKNVASLINERKRKVESINKIAKWQSTIEGWEVSEDRPQEDGKGKVVRGKLKRKMSLRLIEAQFSLNCWAIQTMKLRHKRSRCCRGKMS